MKLTDLLTTEPELIHSITTELSESAYFSTLDDCDADDCDAHSHAMLIIQHTDDTPPLNLSFCFYHTTTALNMILHTTLNH